MNLKAKGGWSRQQTLKLINEWKQRVFLYKVTHPDYLKTYKRQKALEEIALALQDIKPNVIAADVRKKIKILQQQISAEKKNMRAATRSGMSPNDVYIPKLWCFNELNFLLNASDEICGQSNVELNTIRADFRQQHETWPEPALGRMMSQKRCYPDLDDTFSENDCSLSSEKAKRSRLDEAAAMRQSTNKSMEIAFSLIQKRFAEEESKEDIFCKMLGTELKQLKLTETYDNVTTEMLLMVRRAKAAERERLPWQLPREATLYSDQSSLQSSVSSLDEYPADSLHNSTLVLETSGIESLDNVTYVEEGEDCIQNLEGNNNNIGKRVEIQSVQILKQKDILQQALQSIFYE